jgi:hypothetical protein
MTTKRAVALANRVVFRFQPSLWFCLQRHRVTAYTVLPAIAGLFVGKDTGKRRTASAKFRKINEPFDQKDALEVYQTAGKSRRRTRIDLLVFH